MGSTNKDLLDLEQQTSSFIESRVRICDNDSLSQKKRGQAPSSANEKLLPAPMPASNVLGKVKDFLGVMAEANIKLQLDTQKKSPADYDIEALSGNETQYIEMELLLGVADLNTPEAVVAAESAMAGSVVSTFGSDSSSDTEDDDDEEPNSDKDESENTHPPEKRPKITELH